MPGELGQSIPLVIEKCVFGGDGLAHWGARAVFVPGALPGEEVLVRVTEEKKDFLRGRLEEVKTPSPHRIAPACPRYGECPGCAYRHCTPACENELKNAQFAEFAVRAGFAPETLETPLAPGPADGYRNKLVLHVGKAGGDTEIGYLKSDGQTVFAVGACPLAHPDINALLAKQLADPGFRHSVHHRMTLTYRRTEKDGVLFYRNAAPKNLSWLHETTAAGELRCPADGFFQVHPGGADALLNEVRRRIAESKPDVFLDLCCGAGLFAAAAALERVPHILGGDIAETSVAAAQYNLRERGRPDAEFVTGDAASLVRPAAERFAGKRILAVLDPPRGGIAGKMRQVLQELPAGSRLMYISCHPATWSRDAAVLMANGFAPVAARMLNQFPRTAHLEVVSLLERRSA